MAPTHPWGKKAAPKPLSIGRSDVQPVNSGPGSSVSPFVKSQCQELQEDELIALASIYGDDFKLVESNIGAWKKSDPCFEISIKSSDKDLAVTLAVTLTATYPKSIPLLILKDDDELPDGTKFKLQKIIKTKPKDLVAEEQAMIMEIVNACLDVLEDAAQAKAMGTDSSSLEEERAAHQAAAMISAQGKKEQQEEQRRLETLEEERIQEALLLNELNRQRAKAKETKLRNRPRPAKLAQAFVATSISGQAPHETLSLEQPISLLDTKGNLIRFQTVVSKVCIRRGPTSKCFTVRPFVTPESSDVPTLLLKQTDLGTEVRDKKLKTKLHSLESELKILKNAKHQNILDILDFRVHRTVDKNGESDSAWTVSILTEFAEKGSLQEFLDIAGSLGVEKVRSWTIELLDALRFLHEKGIIHEDVHAGNVLLVRSTSGEIRAKLADAGYQRKLRDLSGNKCISDKISVARSAYWIPPEIVNSSQPQYTQKTDVWEFGILFLQMMFGLAVVQKYSSPIAMAESLALSVSLTELVLKMFRADPKKRPRAVELIPSEFLATDAPILEDDASIIPSRYGSSSSFLPANPRKQQHDSINTSGTFQNSRYRQDFVEEGRLGKGGFGEVVKARKRLDGQIYAIKKIMQKSSTSLTEVLKEVRLLSQLSHPSVVRYYNTWTEEFSDELEADDDTMITDDVTAEKSRSDVSPGTDLKVEIGASTGGLDFISSSAYPQIEFGYDDATDEDEDDEYSDDCDKDDSESQEEQYAHAGKLHHRATALSRTRSTSRLQRPGKIILYISMEYCEKQTLRDLIKRGLCKENEEIWRLFRQILEGLVHIHGLNVVHRDLKPENIFIDAASNVKIGDFGLATSGQYTMTDKVPGQLMMSGDMTRSIGTAFYVAPEVKSAVGGTYTSKVDMYSLGIIFFEMCFRPLIPGMDRALVGEGLRKEQPEFPAEFKIPEKPVEADIVLSLLNHSPKERPSSSELLRSGKLPLQMENETIRQALAGLTDSKSPYYDKMMKALFSLKNDRARDFAWEMGNLNCKSGDLLLQGLVKQRLIEIFRSHGAVETPRTILFPRSSHYGANAVQLLDDRGTILQLPYDLTLPHARDIAKHEPAVERSFAFGRVFRDQDSGGQPQTFGEVDFDIVSTDTLDLALKEAEVIKVLDEIAGSFPAPAVNPMCFHLNHADLLGHIFDFCRIEPRMRQAVADTLSKLNFQNWSWQKIRTELRSPLIGLLAPSVDDLQRFDFRDTPNKAFQKLKTLFEGTDTFERASSTIAHLRDVLDYTKRFEVRSKIYVTPLGSLNEKFYKGGVIFSCIFDRKIRDVFAAGGRYDSLIQEHRHKTVNQFVERHAVGFNLAWEKMARMPKAKRGFKKPEENFGIWDTKRCDVLVASHDPHVLRTTGITLLQNLWSASISAELARDSRSPEDLLSKYRDEQHSWIVIIKQDSVLKVKSMDQKDTSDTDIPSTQLLTFLKSEIRERDQRNGAHRYQRGKLHRISSTVETEHEKDVRVLIAGTKSKKSNRQNIVEQAQTCAAALTHEMLDGPIAAIETTDQVIELIRATRLSEPETWRMVLHAVPMAERRYLGEVQELMLDLRAQNFGITRNSFVYNFRTGKCVFYDLGA